MSNEICNHLLCSAGIRQRHLVHLCMGIWAWPPNQLLQYIIPYKCIECTTGEKPWSLMPLVVLQISCASGLAEDYLYWVRSACCS